MSPKATPCYSKASGHQATSEYPHTYCKPKPLLLLSITLSDMAAGWRAHAPNSGAHSSHKHSSCLRQRSTLYEQSGERKRIHSGLVVMQAIHPTISKPVPCPVLVAYKIAWSSVRAPRKELPPQLLLLAPPVHAASVSLPPPKLFCSSWCSLQALLTILRPCGCSEQRPLIS